MEKQKKEEFFYEIMSNGLLEVPNSDFEEKLLMKIKAQELIQKNASRNLVTSWAFFLLSIVFGITLCIMLPQIQLSIFNLSTESLELTFQLIFALYVLLSLDLLLHRRDDQKLILSSLTTPYNS